MININNLSKSGITELSDAEASSISGGASVDSSLNEFNAMLEQYEAANLELQMMNLEFKKLESIISSKNKISQAKIG